MSNVIRFGSFQLDLESADLRKSGRSVRLPEQQFQILQMLLLASGGVVSREGIRKQLWPNDTIVEFDRSINAAIMKLRSVLGDTADRPRFIETVARRGYRILVAVEGGDAKPVATLAPPIRSSSLVGQKVSHYRVLDILGRGGMGLVYKGEDLKLNRPVALKFLPEELATDEPSLRRFEREARLASSLNHPNICTIYQVEEHNDHPFIVMELLEGETLRELIASCDKSIREEPGGLPLPQLLDIAMQVAEGLNAAHGKGIIHRDIKPANIFVTRSGTIKILDFGLAKAGAKTITEPIEETDGQDSPADTSRATSLELTLSHPRNPIGTAGYMSPEQVRGESLDQRSDLFSFGILLCEMLCGSNPFGRVSATETMAAILRDPPHLAGDLPQVLMILIRRLLAKQLDQRYQSMADVLADLKRIATEGAAQKEPTAASIPLIGREREFGELKRAMTEAMAGRGSVVMIGGEPGIGKTHLSAAVLEEARRRGAFAGIGHCYEGEGAPPYIPLIEVLEQVVQMAPHASLHLGLAEDAPEIAKLLPELRNIYPDLPPAIQLPPEQQRRFLFNAVRSWMQRSVNVTPAVVVYEDLHWADESTLLLLQHIAQTLPTMAMLIICTYRDVELDVASPLARMLETLLRQKQAMRISLRGLPVGCVEAMLGAMTGQIPPPSLARIVFDETEGNPFFVEEVIRHLAEEGKLFDETGKWLPELRIDQLHVPESVRLVLGRRLDRLGEDARRVLTTAAVIGRSFSLRLLEEVENKDSDAVLDGVEEGEKAHHVVAEPVGRDTRYRFVHEIVRHTLSESLSLPRRQRIHARVAEAIERVYATHLEAQASALAHHLYQAGSAADPEKTTTYLELAARQARDATAHEEALAHLDKALSLWEGEADLRVGELMAQRAGALRSLGRATEAVISYQKAIDLYEAEGAVSRAVEIYLDLAIVHVWSGGMDAAESVMGRALRHLDGADLRSKIILLTGILLVQNSSGNMAAASITLAQVKNLHQTAGIPFGGYPAVLELFLLWSSGQYARLLELCPGFAAELRKSGNRWLESEVDRMWRAAQYYCGCLSQAAAALPDAIQRAERIGHHGSLWVLKDLDASLFASCGDVAACERGLREALEFGQANDVPWSIVSRVGLSECIFYRGDLAEVEQIYSEPSPIDRKTYLAGTIASARFAVLARCGDERAAEAWETRSWEFPEPGQPNSLGSWNALMASVIGLASMGRKAEAALLRPLTEEFLLTGTRLIRSSALCQTIAGIAAACAEDWAAAEEHHITAIHQTDTAPYKHLQPVARQWYAVMLLERNGPGDAEKGRAMLQAAVNMFEGMGMTYPVKLANEINAVL
jgi:serine/threonine protein kinase/tetratricopeptide (TPR) repeat protein